MGSIFFPAIGQPAAPSAPADPFDDAAIRHSVPVNLLRALGEAGIADPEEIAAKLSGPLSQGKKASEALRGTVPDERVQEIIARANAIFDNDPGSKPLSPGAAPKEKSTLRAGVEAAGGALKRGGLTVAAGPGQIGAGIASQVASDIGKSEEEIYQDEVRKLGPTPLPEYLNRAREAAVIRHDAAQGADREEILRQGAGWLLSSAKLRAKAQAVPRSKTGQRGAEVFAALPEGHTYTDTFRAIQEHPAETAAFLGETLLESAPPIAAGAATTALTRSPAAGIAMMGGTELVLEAGSSAAEFLAEKGVKVETPEDAARVMENAGLMADAQARGVDRAIPIVLMDMISGGVAGKALAKSPAGDFLAQLMVQGGTGAGGERLGQIMAGQPHSPKDVVLEGLAELGTAPVEVYGVARAARTPRGEPPAPEEEAVPPAPPAAGPGAPPTPAPAGPVPPAPTPPPAGPIARATARGPAPLAPDLVPGEEIEIRTPDGEELAATIVGESPTGLIINEGGVEQEIPRESIESGEVTFRVGPQELRGEFRRLAETRQRQEGQIAPPTELAAEPVSQSAQDLARWRPIRDAEEATRNESQLRQHLAFIEEQGRTNGWNKRLTTARDKILAEIEKLTKAETERQRAELSPEPQPTAPGRITKKDGSPFKEQAQVKRAARAAGQDPNTIRIMPVEGGFVGEIPEGGEVSGEERPEEGRQEGGVLTPLIDTAAAPTEIAPAEDVAAPLTPGRGPSEAGEAGAARPATQPETLQSGTENAARRAYMARIRKDSFEAGQADFRAGKPRPSINDLRKIGRTHVNDVTEFLRGYDNPGMPFSGQKAAPAPPSTEVQTEAPPSTEAPETITPAAETSIPVSLTPDVQPVISEPEHVAYANAGMPAGFRVTVEPRGRHDTPTAVLRGPAGEEISTTRMDAFSQGSADAMITRATARVEAEAAKPKPKEEGRAEEVREDQGLPEGGGKERRRGEDQRGEDLQRPEEAGAGPGDRQAPREEGARPGLTEAELHKTPEGPSAPSASPTEKLPGVYGTPDKPLKFISGMSRSADFIAVLEAGKNVGISINALSTVSIPKLADALAAAKSSHLFVDSGAFSIFMANIKAKAKGVEAFDDLAEGETGADFDAILERYEELHLAIGKADPSGSASERVFFVMPDIVGDQAGSLDLVKRYAEHIGGPFHHIVPLQGGELTLAEAYETMMNNLGLDPASDLSPIIGIPSKAAAVSNEEFAELLAKHGDRIDGVHILGAVSDKALSPRIEALKAANYDHNTSADANRLRALMTGGSSRAEAMRAMLHEGGLHKTPAEPEKPTGPTTAYGQAVVAAAQANPNFPDKPPQKPKIQDFGEKIGGARKDKARKSIADLRAERQTRTMTLTEAFPEPDYEALAASSIVGDVLAVAAVARSGIDRKPSARSWLVREWAEGVDKRRAAVADLLEGVTTPAEAMEAMGFRDSDKALVRMIQILPPEHVALGSRFKAHPGTSKYDVATSSYRKVFGLTEPDQPEHRIQHTFETESDAAAYVAEWVPAEIARREVAPARTRKPVEIDIKRVREGEIWLGFKVSGWVDVEGPFASRAEAATYLKENREEIQAKAEKMRVGPAERRLTNRPRVGPERRKGDVTPEMFTKAFGFRGVEFGNWTTGEDRQIRMNEAYDALMDLAGALGVPTETLSLDGKLGLAFGARGQGGMRAAAAHYEPDFVVINLTKKTGAGSLAHEWWHAVDHHLGKLDAKDSDVGAQHTGEGGERSEYMSDRRRGRGSLSDDEYALFRRLRATLHQMSAPWYIRSVEFDKARSKPYFQTVIEMAARGFEHHVVERLRVRGMTNDFLANINELGGAYPTASEARRQGVTTAFDKAIGVISARFAQEGTKPEMPEVDDSLVERGPGVGFEWEAPEGKRKIVSIDGDRVMVAIAGVDGDTKFTMRMVEDQIDRDAEEMKPENKAKREREAAVEAAKGKRREKVAADKDHAKVQLEAYLNAHPAVNKDFFRDKLSKSYHWSEGSESLGSYSILTRMVQLLDAGAIVKTSTSGKKNLYHGPTNSYAYDASTWTRYGLDFAEWYHGVVTRRQMAEDEAAAAAQAEPEKPAEAPAEDDLDAMFDRILAEETAPVAATETAGIKPAKPAKPAPLYVHRPVEPQSAERIISWAKEQGFKSTLKPEDMHVTIAFSSDPVDASTVPPVGTPVSLTLTSSAAAAHPKRLGDEGAVVLPLIQSGGANALGADWQRYRDAGASWDFKGYQPHITITYEPGDVDLSKVAPFTGLIKLGPEVQEPLDTDAVSKVVEVPTAEAPKVQPETAKTEKGFRLIYANEATPEIGGFMAAVKNVARNVTGDGRGATREEAIANARQDSITKVARTPDKNILSSIENMEVEGEGRKRAEKAENLPPVVSGLTAGAAAKSAVKETAKGLDAATKGLMELFGGKNKLSVGLTFDAETYAAAKPHFIEAAQHFGAAAGDIAAAMRAVIKHLLNAGMTPEDVGKMRPYVIQFMKDVQDGAISLEEAPDESGGRGQAGELGEGGEPEAGPPAGEPAGEAGDRGLEEPAAGPAPGDAGEGGASGAGARAGGEGAGSGGRIRAGGVEPGGRPRDSLRGVDDDGARRAEQEAPGRSNYRITDPAALFGGGPKGRFRKNRAAIEAMQAIEAENREPTSEELDAMAAYIGWGSFGQELFQGTWDYPRIRDEWRAENEWLRATLGKDDWESANNSIVNAHYTDPPTVQAIWAMLEKMGFRGGRILEPALGVGNFFGLMPPDVMSGSDLTGIEKDTTTGRMAQLLYPRANVRIMPYEKSRTPDDFYDLAVGNWPFLDVEVADRRYQRLKPTLHNYFFLKAIDQVRPGGLVAGVTSSFTMDGSKWRGVRLALAKKAELVGSWRLPSGAFEGYAGTAVVTDLIVLKKRPEPIMDASGAGWIDLEKVNTPSGHEISVNEYYVKNPSNVLGRLNFGTVGSTFGRPSMVVERQPDYPVRLASIPDFVIDGSYSPIVRGKEDRFVANNTEDRQLSIIAKNGGFWQVTGERLTEMDSPGKAAPEVTALIELRRKAGAVLDADRDAAGNADTLRASLKKAYTAFRKAHGPVNESAGLRWLRRVGDPFYAMLRALETYDGDPAAILDRPTVRSVSRIDKPSINDAFVLSRNETAALDLPGIAEKAGATVEAVTTKLLDDGAIFRTPGGGYEIHDAYLSGNVRVKLREAKDALADGEDMEASIKALEAVQPPDVPYFSIEARIGADWIPPEHFKSFIAEQAGVTDTDGIEVIRAMSGWNVRMIDDRIERRPEARRFQFGASARKGGGPGVTFAKFMQYTMNSQTIDVKSWSTDAEGRDILTKDPQLTEAANNLAGEIREAFSAWIWKDPERRVELERAYNETMNAIADATFDGSFLEFPGMAIQRGADPLNLRNHQANAIWRGLMNQRGVFGHEVGTGKSIVITGLAVESRRFGLARKPLVLAHNANSAALAAEAQATYPGGKFLYVDNLAPADIKTTLHRIATEDWDAIVMPHSLLKNLTLKEETLMAMAADDIASYEREAIDAAAEEGVELTVEMIEAMEGMDAKEAAKILNPRAGSGVRTAKEMVKARARIIENIRKQAAASSKEDAISFEDLGIDMILVDEVQAFKKPPIVTRMTTKGLNKGLSEGSLAMRFLTNYVKSIRGGKGVFTFTGTPITNTLSEIYHQLYYVMDDVMRFNHVDTWDGFFKAFADSVPDVEVTAVGDYESVERLNAFINVAELRRLAGQYLDIVFADDMPEFQPRKTKSGKTIADPTLTSDEKEELRNGVADDPAGRPYKHVIHDIGPMSPDQERIFDEVKRHAVNFRAASGKQRYAIMHDPINNPPKPIVFNSVPNRASMDARLQEISAGDHPESKANRAVTNIAKIYSDDARTTQILFVDQGYSDTATKTIKNEKGDVIGKERVAKFNLTKDIVDKLVAKGVKRSEIAVVGGGWSGADKRELAEKMNRREIRIAIGQSGTIGVGVNAQEWLRAMHHLDAPWMPGDLEQRNGRGHRQGNRWNTVLEYRYLTEGLDGRRWQVLAIKDRFIKAFLKADMTIRVIEGDATEEADSMDAAGLANTLAEAAGDPRIIKINKLRKKVERLQRRERLHTEGIADARQRIRSLKESIARRKANLTDMEADAAAVVAFREKLFEATIGGTIYKSTEDKSARAEAEQAIKIVTDGTLTMKGGETRDLPIEIGGFKIKATVHQYQRGKVDFTMVRKGEYSLGSGSLAAIEANLRRLPVVVQNIKSEIEGDVQSLANLERASDQPFGQQKDLEKAKADVEAITEDMQKNPVPPPSWLRQGAPEDTVVFVDGKEHVVTGHRWDSSGWFILAGEKVIPYLDAKDDQGAQIFDEKPFEAPNVVQTTTQRAAALDIAELEREGFTAREENGQWVLINPSGAEVARGDSRKAVFEAIAEQRRSHRHSITREVPSVTFMQARALRMHLEQSPLGKTIVKAIDAGRIKLHDDATKSDPERAHAKTDQDGVIHLYARRLNSRTAVPALLHEMFHAGVEPLIGSKAWEGLMARMERLMFKVRMADVGAAMVRRPAADDWWLKASRRLYWPSVGVEEFAAYAIEEYQSAPAGVRELVDRILGAVKAFMLRRFGRQLGAVTPAQLRSLAIQALRAAPPAAVRRDLELRGMDRYSIAADQPQEAEIDAAERGFFGHAVTKAMQGNWNLLGMVPGRPLFDELGAAMPSAQEYLRLKTEMDAMRHAWHDTAFKIEQEWRKLGLKGDDNVKLMDIMHESTLAGTDPTKPFVSKLNDMDLEALRSGREGTALDIATRKQAEDEDRRASHTLLRRRLRALPPAFTETFETVRDAYKDLNDEFEKALLLNIEKAMDFGVRRAQREFDAEKQRLVDEGVTGPEFDEAMEDATKKLATETRRHTWGKGAKLNKLRAQMETQRIAEPYFPLARFGPFFATVRDAENGTVIAFSRFESPREQAKFKKEQEAQGHKVETGVLGERSLRTMVDPGFVADIEAILAATDVGNKVMDSIWQRWLETLPDLSIRKSRIHRKGTPGFSSDAFRAFGHHMFHGSHQLARLRWSIEMKEALNLAKEEADRAEDPVRTGLIWQEMERRHEFTMNPTGAWWAQLASTASFIYYLSMTPAAALVNISQTSVMGTPILGAFHGGMGVAAKHLTRALRDFAGGSGETWRDQISVENNDRLAPDEKDAIIEAKRRAVIEATQSHDLAGVSETGVKSSDIRRKWMGRIAWFFHHAERVNREVTFLAAYRMAREKGLDHVPAVDKAAALTWKIHYDYQRTSRSRIAQSDLGQVLLVFKSFVINSLFRLFRDSQQALNGATAEERREARGQLLGITAMMMLHAGVRGVWGMNLILMLAGMLMGGDSDDAEDELQRAVTSVLGKHLGGIVLHGLPGYAFGIDLTHRIGMPDLWFRSPDRVLEGEDAYHYWLSEFLGAFPGIVEQFVVGGYMVVGGHPWRGMEMMAPKFARDIMRTVRFMNEGANTIRGDPLIEDVSLADAFKQAIGFTPAKLAQQYDINAKLRNRQQAITDEKSEILNRIWRDVKNGRPISAKVRDQMLDFNARVPQEAINGETIKRSFRGRIGWTGRMVGGLALDPDLGPMLRAELPEPIY